MGNLWHAGNREIKRAAKLWLMCTSVGRGGLELRGPDAFFTTPWGRLLFYYLLIYSAPLAAAQLHHSWVRRGGGGGAWYHMTSCGCKNTAVWGREVSWGPSKRGLFSICSTIWDAKESLSRRPFTHRAFYHMTSCSCNNIVVWGGDLSYTSNMQPHDVMWMQQYRCMGRVGVSHTPSQLPLDVMRLLEHCTSVYNHGYWGRVLLTIFSTMSGVWMTAVCSLPQSLFHWTFASVWTKFQRPYIMKVVYKDITLVVNNAAI